MMSNISRLTLPFLASLDAFFDDMATRDSMHCLSFGLAVLFDLFIGVPSRHVCKDSRCMSPFLTPED